VHLGTSGTSVEFAGFLFVDNTDLIALSATITKTAPHVIARIQDAVRTWHCSLRASGGALKPEKCSWCLADFAWKRGQRFYTSIADTPSNIVVPNLQGSPTPIDSLEPSDAGKVVSVQQSLDGNMSAQVLALKEKADAWAERIQSGWLPQNLAHQGRNVMIWSSLKYPLPACTITEQECLTITKELHWSLLPKRGAMRNYPLVYHHAPASLQGLGFPLLIHIEQAIGHLC
jgi:hypothetical protein